MDKIILGAAFITGCPTPSTDYYANHLSEEMITYLSKYGYDELTLEEILTALRLNTSYNLKQPTGYEIQPVHFEGACFHITFLAKVLYNYCILRGGLERKLQNFIEGY